MRRGRNKLAPSLAQDAREQSTPLQPSGQSHDAQSTGWELLSLCSVPPFAHTGSPTEIALRHSAQLSCESIWKTNGSRLSANTEKNALPSRLQSNFLAHTVRHCGSPHHQLRRDCIE